MIKIDKKSISRKDSIAVSFFYNQIKTKFKFKSFTGEIGFERLIKDQNLHRPGLALAGFVELFTFNRIQIFGNTEFRYLKQLSSEKKLASLDKLFNFDLPCIILTDKNEPFPEMLEKAEQYNIPIFGSTFPTTKLYYLVTDFLDDQFATRASVHGSFVDVYGVGMLFVGKSGIGKSEVALDLIERGHRLVADDVVILTKKGEGILIGSGTEMVKHFMEIRGVGIIDIKSMFGVRAIRFHKRLEVVIELEIWDGSQEYTRTGLDNSNIGIMDVEIPHIKLPIVTGKNVTVISEVIALNYLLKYYGYNAAEKFQSMLMQKIQEKQAGIDRSINYFGHDFE